jgi:cell division ATPase FtsA
LHSNYGEKKRRKLHSSKKNSMEDLVGNEENGYSVLDPQKTMINVTNEPSDTYKKKSLKEEIMEEVTEILMEKILDMVNQKVQDALKKFQETTKNLKGHRNN